MRRADRFAMIDTDGLKREACYGDRLRQRLERRVLWNVMTRSEKIAASSGVATRPKNSNKLRNGARVVPYSIVETRTPFLVTTNVVCHRKLTP
jgi:hypothetical protein